MTWQEIERLKSDNYEQFKYELIKLTQEVKHLHGSKTIKETE
jgi:hypothetical protein